MFASDHAQFLYFRSPHRHPDAPAHEDFRAEIVVMSGLPGPGKDTRVHNNLPDWPMVSLDAVRGELDGDPADPFAALATSGGLATMNRESVHQEVFRTSGAEKGPTETMPAESIACPHCQSRVTVADLLSANGSWSCPHCGRTIPAPDLGMVHGIAQTRPESDPQRPPRRLVLDIILQVMALTALLSLTLGLSTVARRRAHDLKPLGYLPEGTNVVGAMHVAKLMDEATGRNFLAQFRLGRDGFDFEHFEHWTGLPRDVIADLALGLRVDERPVPRLTLVVQTLQPYDPSNYLTRLRQPKALERNQKNLYQFDVPDEGIHPVVWLADERTLVFGLSPEDLDDVPLTPRSGVAHLPVALQRFPGDISAPQAQVWWIAHADHWEQTGVWPRLASWLGKDDAVASTVQTLGLWLHFEKAITVGAAAHCRDEAAAQRLDGVLRRQGVDEKGQLRSDKGGWVTFRSQTGLGLLLRWGQGQW